MATDPICGMYVDEKATALRLVRSNRTYYFCSATCRNSFADPTQQLQALRRQLAVAWPLSVAVVVLIYGGFGAVGVDVAFLLATVVQFYPGLTFYRGTRDALRSRTWNMDVLIAVGTSAAYFYSAAVVLLPGPLLSAVYFDASALIISLILTGNYLEHLTREHASGALRRLQDLVPAQARKLVDGQERPVAVTDLRPGDVVRVGPGERVPVDGVLVAGRTSVDESVVTGESFPVRRGVGEPVVGGTMNLDGVIEERATAVGEDTFLAQVGQLMTEAETSRVPLQRTADRLAAVFVPVVLAVAVGAALAWYFVGGAAAVSALLVFVTVAITACPCAFGIATPAAIVVGSGRAAEEGVLFRGEDALERTSQVTVVLADKTGTLTSGHPALVRLLALRPHTEEELLRVAAGLEVASRHPIGEAIRRAAAERGVSPAEVTDVAAMPGAGVTGHAGAVDLAIVHAAAVAEQGVDLRALDPAIREENDLGRSVSILLLDRRPIGLLSFEDPLAEGSREAVARLREEGVAVELVTGDAPVPAGRVADELGIPTVFPRVTPAGKLDRVRARQAAGARVAFVGDGINDAPALRQADAGMAIGTGTDVAREAGRVLILRRDFRAVPFALEAARRTVRKVRQNLAWAVGYNAVLIPIAAGALVPLLGFGVYTVLPVVGAAAMAVSSTTVVLNSLSLRRTPGIGPPASDVAPARAQP